jgi:hypothetical protein
VLDGPERLLRGGRAGQREAGGESKTEAARHRNTGFRLRSTPVKQRNRLAVRPVTPAKEMSCQ